MTRDELIEAMARAQFDRAWGSPAWDRQDADTKDLWRTSSTTALSALEAVACVVPKEPDEAMIDAAISADRPPLRKVTVGDVLKAEYVAMTEASPFRSKP